MNRGVAAGGEARAHAKLVGVILAPDKYAARRTWRLRMAFEAEVIVPLHEHLSIDGAVRLMTRHTAVAQRRVLERMWFRLLPMALRARFIGSCHRQSTRGLHDVHAVRVVALHTVHFPLGHGVMLREVELHVSLQMAGEAGGGVFARIDDELATTTASCDVFAAWSVTRLASGEANHSRSIDMHSRMRTG